MPKFKGRCDVIGLSSHISGAGPLGWTHISDGVILPFAEIDCESIRDFIQRRLLRMPVESHEAAFGRALGRVVAHELYHIFANTVRHSACGVGKPKFSIEELLSPEFRFGAQESFALKSGKAHSALAWAAFRR